MSTAEQVRTAWETSVWKSEMVEAFTPRIYDFPVLAQSQSEVEGLYHEADGQMIVNFFTYTVQRAQDPRMGGQRDQTFRVEVLYHLQQTEVARRTFNLVEDRLGAVDDLVITELGSTWGSTVDFYQGGEPRNIEPFVVDGKSCWRGGYTYLATKRF